MTWRTRCPAKVNLFLAVGPPDPSGYHPIRTVFQAVALFDDLEATLAEADSFSCDSSDVPAENTVTRAWRLAAEYVGLPKLAVKLTKRIPAQSGLGGGSSDAAGLLRVLVRATRGRFTSENAAEVAQAVGADVPFFLVGGRARAEGYGERLTPIADAEPRPLLVVMPDACVSTGEAYAALDAQPYPWRPFVDDPWQLYNDFERVAPCVCGDLAERLHVHGASAAGLTGSGAAVFGVFEDEESARSAAVRLAGEGFERSWPVWTLSREESLWTS